MARPEPLEDPSALWVHELVGAEVVDADGAVLARHDGVHGFTIGQRKGLGIGGPGPDGRPRYVTSIDAESGTVRVGGAEDLDVWTLAGRDPVFTVGAAPAGPVECEVQVRARAGQRGVAVPGGGRQDDRQAARL